MDDGRDQLLALTIPPQSKLDSDALSFFSLSHSGASFAWIGLDSIGFILSGYAQAKCPYEPS